MFTEKDLQQFKALGIPQVKVENQINNFVKGFPSMKLYKPALVGEGIIKYDEAEVDALLCKFDDHIKGKQVIKFVPASGAASRMFKNLFTFLSSEKNNLESDSDEKEFIECIRKFAFISDLESLLEDKNQNLNSLIASGNYKTIIDLVLNESGLNYGMLPKGLLKFHNYSEGSRTAVEEHLVEGALYAKRDNDTVHLHLTVSPEHLQLFEKRVNDVKGLYQEKFGVEYEVSYSVQKKSTDTIAVDMNDQPFREEDGSILFRPGGHGALIENLNDIDAEIIFIKNIDNIAPDRVKDITVRFKKLLFVVFKEFQQKIFSFLNALENGDASDELLSNALQFVENEMNTLNDSLDKSDKHAVVSYLKKKLNRPIRVGGMVSSEGDTGGGPFWAYNPDGTISLQIVETAQIDLNDAGQYKIFNDASHFNPNDLVCGVKDYKGNKFDLTQFVDHTAGFIAKKSKDGRDLKAQELPGLWNGSMSDWNTIFVDVPIQTFSPVKKVNDLLEDEHQ